MNGENVTANNVNSIIRSVQGMSPDYEEQLSILANAFVVTCKSFGVDRQFAAKNIRKLFAQDQMLVPLDQASQH